MKTVDFTLRWMGKVLVNNYNQLDMVFVRIHVSRRLRWTGVIMSAVIPPHYDRTIEVIDENART